MSYTLPNFHTELCWGDYWELFQVQIWLVKFVFCQPIRFKTRANGQTFQFGKIQNSKVCLPWKAEAEKVAIINKIASALTVCVEVSEACQTKLMKKSAYFLDNTLTAQTTYFDFKFRKVISSFFIKSRENSLVRHVKLVSSFFKNLVKLPNDKPVGCNCIDVNDISKCKFSDWFRLQLSDWSKTNAGATSNQVRWTNLQS